MYSLSKIIYIQRIKQKFNYLVLTVSIEDIIIKYEIVIFLILLVTTRTWLATLSY